MRVYYFVLIVAISIFYSSIVKSQNLVVTDLKKYEDSLNVLHKSIFSNEEFSKKEIDNENFLRFLRIVLKAEESFQYPFDSLKHLGKIVSDDKKIRIYTWNLPLAGGYQKYYGFIQHQYKKGKIKLFELTDNRNIVVDQIGKSVPSEEWIGALYYKVITKKIRNHYYYFLLGLDFNNKFSSKKLIDVISFDRNDNPIFGAPIFKVGNNLLYRVIFEYSASASMVLRYNDENEMIVFDHLSPSRPDFTGNYQFYGPDFSYDGFEFRDDYWIYIQDLDLRNTERIAPMKIEDPEKLPEPGFLYKSNIKY